VSCRLLSRSADQVAPRLLGSVLTVVSAGTPVSVRITEVEAYGGVGEDPGSHAFRGQTPRNATMFGPAGLLYVYFTYGMHWCANVVTGRQGQAGAVLLRAGEVIDGIELARERRPNAKSDRDLARGPARLTKALGLDGSADGVDLFADDSITFRLASRPIAPEVISARTGVGGAGAHTHWRFALDDPTVSPYRPAARA
jgi:DNA-3-methyladenine glycosylase